MEEMQKIYFAASLFNQKECFYNLKIAEKLEKLGYLVYLPQRDGFEFSELGSQSELTEQERQKAVAWIIYLADIAKLSLSTICLANMDEPLDSGVLVEIMFAKSLGIPTVGYRCDSRSPFGNLQEWNFGMHFFPLFQFDYFFNSLNDGRKSFKESSNQVDELVERMHEKMKNLQRKETQHQHEELLNLAYELIPSPLNPSDMQLSQIVRKYNEMKDRLEKIEPKIFKI